MGNRTKIIEIQRRPDTSEVISLSEKYIEHDGFRGEFEYEPFRNLTEAKNGERKVNITLREAFLSNPDAANILRNDIKYIAFTTFAQMQRSFEGFVRFENSSRPQEEYLRDAAIGALPIVPSGTVAQELQSNFEGGTIVANNRYAGIVSVLGDWVRFDQIGKIRQVAEELGRSGRLTEENAVYSVITTTGNFSRNSTTNDNDVGANTAATTFNALGLDLGLSTIATSKDRKSGNYLGYRADTLICGPRMEFPVKQLLMSSDLQRATGSSAEARGMGTFNVYAGVVNRIVVSPWFGTSYQWALVDSTVRSLIYQTVEPFNVYQEDANVTSEAWLTKDVVRYLVQGYFGVGIVDDRAWFYSSSSTAPTVV
jgi:hypothetical protein